MKTRLGYSDKVRTRSGRDNMFQREAQDITSFKILVKSATSFKLGTPGATSFCIFKAQRKIKKYLMEKKAKKHTVQRNTFTLLKTTTTGKMT
jgi:hypothetical protein